MLKPLKLSKNGRGQRKIGSRLQILQQTLDGDVM
jgi:hypothetical protein